LKKKAAIQKSEEGQNLEVPDSRRKRFLLLFRWLMLIFSVILCISSPLFASKHFAIIETLSVAAIFNIAVTAYIIKDRTEYITAISYTDIFLLMILIFFSGGIDSELFVLLLFFVGHSGLYKPSINIIKYSVVSIVLYTAICVMSGVLYDSMKIPVLLVRDLLLLLAAFTVSGIYKKVRKYDEMRKKEFKLARTDKLTGLANRHYFEQKLGDEVDYALSCKTVVNVLMFDLDNFKQFNDTYGHVAGDKLLTLFADIIRQCIRNTDIPIRYGGEEFLIMIRDLDVVLARSVADRIRRNLERQHIYLNEQNEKRVTVSCGIAQFPTHSRNIKEVIEKADEALYYAKRIGKNIVVAYEDIGQTREVIEQYASNYRVN